MCRQGILLLNDEASSILHFHTFDVSHFSNIWYSSFSHFATFSVGSYICFVILAFIFSCLKGTAEAEKVSPLKWIYSCLGIPACTKMSHGEPAFENLSGTLLFESRSWRFIKPGKSVFLAPPRKFPCFMANLIFHYFLSPRKLNFSQNIIAHSIFWH